MAGIAVFFPGQGSQGVAMGQALCDNYQIARQTFDEADDVLGLDLKRVCVSGSLDELTRSEYAQLAVFTTSVAAWRVCEQELGLSPVCGAGHSLGEISALTCSGAIEFSQALRLIQVRARLMAREASPDLGKRALIIGPGPCTVELWVREIVDEGGTIHIANYNSSCQHVLSGTAESLKALRPRAQAVGAQFVPFSMLHLGAQDGVDAPFHGPLMQGFADRFSEEIARFSFRPCRWPVISNVTGRPYGSHDRIPDLLSRHLISPVQWYRTVVFAENAGADIFLEVGHGSVLSKIYKESEGPAGRLRVFTFQDDLTRVKAALCKRLLGCLLGVAVSTRNRSRENETYTTRVLEPYRRIEEVAKSLDTEEAVPTRDQMELCVQLVGGILDAKSVPHGEASHRIAAITSIFSPKSE